MGISIPFIGSLGSRWNKPNKNPTMPPNQPPEPMTEDQLEIYMKRWETFKRQNKKPPDYRRFKKVENDLTQNPLFDDKDNPTPEEIEENQEVWKQLENNDFLKFAMKSEEYAQEALKDELEEDVGPFWDEDRKMWKALPRVPGPFNGPPMPKKSIVTPLEGQDKFLDFFKEHFFGLWGFRNRPYPPAKPCDAQQALGSEFLEERNFTYAMKYGRWYYKDRLGRTRGPMHIVNLKTAMASGIVDKDTFVWGDDMDEWAPLGMVYGLEPAVNGLDVKLSAAGTALLYKMCKGFPSWVPIKGRERKTYEQLQNEGIESKEREKAVMRQHGGVWPGQMIPSHTMFLWASGPELTSLIQGDTMPNKCIPYELRKDLAKVIPGVRPNDVLTLERVMHRITYNKYWYSQCLGEFNRAPYYLRQVPTRDKRKLAAAWRWYKKLYRRVPNTISEFYHERIEEDKDIRLEKCYAKLQKCRAKLEAEERDKYKFQKSPVSDSDDDDFSD